MNAIYIEVLSSLMDLENVNTDYKPIHSGKDSFFRRNDKSRLKA